MITGPETLLVFSNIDIPEMFPHLYDVEAIHGLWKYIFKINQLHSVTQEDTAPHNIREFETRVKAYVNTFVYIYPAMHVTPYIHCMMMHVTEFVTLHGAIVRFTQQGMDKYNDPMTKD